MKKNTKIIIGIVSFLAIVIVSTILIYWAHIIIEFSKLGGDFEPKIIQSVDSPNKKYTMHIYYIDGGPISADTFIVYIYDNKKKKEYEIYYGYNEKFNSSEWIDNKNVVINGRKLNIYKDKYNSHNN